ncbi:MAG: hypothetical protein ONB05_05740 [candidate division KSB1 bacterium]|nr:hypothetical protein [candidate division KSB1 bacterium]
MRFSILTYLLSIVLVSVAWGHTGLAKLVQNACDDSLLFKIVSIELYGNEKTKAEVILREMKVKVGNCATLEQLEEDRKRIQNLGLFNRVELEILNTEAGLILQIQVTERWYIFPFPILDRNEKDWSKLSYGLGLMHQNFRGRNENLQAQFWLGYNPGLSFSYSNPWLGGKWQLFTTVTLFAGKIKSKSLEIERFDEHRKSISWSLGKKFGYHTYWGLGLAYTRLTASPSMPGQTLSSSGLDQWLTYLMSFRYDNRDLREYPHKGWDVTLGIQKNGKKGSTINYSQYQVDIRKYLPFSQTLTLATRGSIRLSRGKIPLYSRVFLGYEEQVRGHFHDVFEGENSVLGGIELRFPIRKITYYSWDSAPAFSEYYRNLKFGISAGLFVDTGAVWFQQQKFNAKKLNTGFGLGLHFHVPYIDVLRLEYALDEKLTGQIIWFDTGVAF